MKKKVTAAAFRLSGAGWYETDFKAGNKKKNLTETASESKEKKSADTKKESKDGSKKSSETTSSKTESSSTDTSKPKQSKEPSTD